MITFQIPVTTASAAYAMRKCFVYSQYQLFGFVIVGSTLISSKAAVFLTGYSGSASEVDGSGADRSSNAETIKNGIQEYVKSLKLVNNTVGEYHLVFFTTNGGTGSVMGPLFIQELQYMGLLKRASYANFGYEDVSYLHNSKTYLERLRNVTAQMRDYREPFDDGHSER